MKPKVLDTLEKHPLCLFMELNKQLIMLVLDELLLVSILSYKVCCSLSTIEELVTRILNTYLFAIGKETEVKFLLLFIWEIKYMDKERIGIFGWSYGGFMSSLCISKERCLILQLR